MGADGTFRALDERLTQGVFFQILTCNWNAGVSVVFTTMPNKHRPLQKLSDYRIDEVYEEEGEDGEGNFSVGYKTNFPVIKIDARKAVTKIECLVSNLIGRTFRRWDQLVLRTATAVHTTMRQVQAKRRGIAPIDVAHSSVFPLYIEMFAAFKASNSKSILSMIPRLDGDMNKNMVRTEVELLQRVKDYMTTYKSKVLVDKTWDIVYTIYLTEFFAPARSVKVMI